ncbi:hypothetical protein [Microcella alkaliphila]|jgi:hypothetical protein|uniref:Uncharacterized protein n=1 Tax=Microcella alkaliphila TaxID=279828 RepID=A0A0U5B848_9MICO|nr:hypothetical protein [Microcella alkaliphila]BAU32016.1 uncharacterized protein MalAC0309_1158 [Microcella alkaliphila]
MDERGAETEPATAEPETGEHDAGDLDAPDEGLLSQLALIDDQPLEDRAAAFAQLHDALRQQLEA